ncbi:hypothetical protein [Agromyces archimandritae]|uniref:Lipoprotein n=1 Tax=Agromyces archimandritae TaxID=2781962 RepID=A0A975FPE7_9MICO|nr:hypothetical protein [Agromyces archimandritae]QTX05681.1 hypothetical protein G127AT_05605 [Agromyces archimandritae]
MALTPRPVARLAAVLCAGALIGTLAACTPDEPKPTKTPAATTDGPIFESDEEAFEAAKAAYERFHEVLADVTASGGQGEENLDEVATGEELELARKDAAEYREVGAHTSGRIELDYDTDIQAFQEPDRGAVIQFTVCEDVSRVDLLDSAGTSLVESDRDPTTPFEVTVEGTTPDSLKVSRRWMHGSFC